jgi:molybdate transport system substrate-binding protein
MPHHSNRVLQIICLALTIFVGISASSTVTRADDKITVFAAASLTNAIEAATKAYCSQTGIDVRLSLASSSTLARQIAAGAPADIFISANERWMTWLSDQDLILPNSRYDLLSNTLVVIAPADRDMRAITIDATTDFSALIGPNDRIAMGDPDHVPAGIYAKQALQSLGQWDQLAPRLARSDNVRAALALVERGEAPLGIVYGTDGKVSDGVKVIGTLPESSHTPIKYPVAVMGQDARPEVLQFLLWLLGDDAGSIFTDYGFVPLAKNTSTQMQK